MDKKSWRLQEGNLVSPRYKGVQKLLRCMLQRMIIKVFSDLQYELDTLTNVHAINWGMPSGLARDAVHQFCKRSVDCLDSAADYMLPIQVQTFKTFLLQHVGIPVLADMLMDVTEPVVAGKNWNSHGGHLGRAVCRMATILVGCIGDTEDFHSFRPLALGGQRHGGN